jgi:UDP-glucuronate 4-epimerase
MKILLTGVAGFIGLHVAGKLLDRGDEVVGIDNLNDYYDVTLKRDRLQRLSDRKGFRFHRFGLEDRARTAALFAQEKPQCVMHLAAQAGVRHSLSHPHEYVDANLAAFLNVIEGCRHHGIDHLVFASSSSVYGNNQRTPFTEDQAVDHPISLYAATKRANELMAHTYSHLFGLPMTGLRFFTVYGPWGRPDMAFFKFTRAMLAGEPIQVFNHGRMIRDFTYVDDIVEGVIRVLDKPATPVCADTDEPTDPSASAAPFRLFNIGSGHPVPLMDYIDALEHALGVQAIRDFQPMQEGEVMITHASTDALDRWVGYRPSIRIEVGIPRFVDWYRSYYQS